MERDRNPGKWLLPRNSLSWSALALVLGGLLAYFCRREWLARLDARHSGESVIWKPFSSEMGHALLKQDLPNIIVIVADDLGFNDVNRGVGVDTPNINSIRANGADLKSGYAGHATCAPSRAAIMTGNFPTRFGFEFTPIPWQLAYWLANSHKGRGSRPIWDGEHFGLVPSMEKMSVPSNVTFFASVLASVGYRSIFFGKWHLGEEVGARPTEKGYHESLCFLSGASLYYPLSHPDSILFPLNNALDRFLRHFLKFQISFNNGPPFEPDDYMTDYLSTQASHAIRSHFSSSKGSSPSSSPDRTPLHIFLSFNAPHNPLQARRQDYLELSHISSRRARVYGSMLRALDRGVGRVLDALREAGELDNSLVIFTSDNGGAHYVGLPGLNYPFKGWKATFFEGGVRVPLFMQWPRYIPKGTSFLPRAGHVDIFQTILGAVRMVDPSIAPAIESDGEDLLSFLIGDPPMHDPNPRLLFWRSGHYKAMVYGDMKVQISERPRFTRVYNLSRDSCEAEDLSNNTLLAAPLLAMLQEMDQHQSPPIWPSLIEYPIPVSGLSCEDSASSGEACILWPN